MASLIEQMQQLQKQQADLAEKIIREEERKRRLMHRSTIERLEALINPITQKLDYIDRTAQSSLRQTWEAKFVQQCNQSSPPTKYQSSHMLANEEIFVTLLNIIKKQDARIAKLEAINVKNNEEQNNEEQNNGEYGRELWDSFGRGF